MSDSPVTKRRKLDRRAIALQRWNILREILLSGRSLLATSEYAASVRRFKSFGLLKTYAESNKKDEEWFIYTAPKWPDFLMNIRHLNFHVKPDALLGFNNTGNVCVWPSEEILTYYCLCYKNIFSGKSVIELGGGMTCLAGVALCVTTDVSYVELTDGNEDSVTNLKSIIKRNSDCIGETKLSSRMLRWGCGELDKNLEEKFDFVLCADCLFFEEGREDLVTMVHDLLKPGGKSLMFAPSRGDTFDIFVKLCKSLFDVKVKENYDEDVWTIHSKMKEKGLEHYDENIHYPLFLELTKSSQLTEISNGHSNST
ncbi:hypothetical protein ACF0H5_002148 [Mactra antiquata]